MHVLEERQLAICFKSIGACEALGETKKDLIVLDPCLTVILPNCDALLASSY